jgi:hypothetical protein
MWGSSSLKRLLAPLFLAVTLVIGSGAGALAFDCLTSKPAGARGYWHSQSVAGKTCWFGADWRSFLATSKAQAQPSAAQAEPARAAKSEPASEPDTEPKSESQPPAAMTPSAAESTDAEQPQDPPGLRQATPAEAAALINSISLDFEPAAPAAPPPAKSQLKAAPEAHVAQSHNTGDWLITFGELAIIGGVLATLIRQFRRRRAMKAQRAQPQFMPVSLRFAPPLQPGISDDVQSPRQVPWATAMRSARTDTLSDA